MRRTVTLLRALLVTGRTLGVLATLAFGALAVLAPARFVVLRKGRSGKGQKRSKRQ